MPAALKSARLENIIKKSATVKKGLDIAFEAIVCEAVIVAHLKHQAKKTSLTLNELLGFVSYRI